MVLFCTTPFVQMAHTLVAAAGTPQLRIVEAPHPLGGRQEAEVRTWVADIADQVMNLLGIAGQHEGRENPVEGPDSTP